MLLAVSAALAAAHADEPVPKADGDRMNLEGWWDVRFWRGPSSGGAAEEPPLPDGRAVWGQFCWPHHWYTWTMTSPEISDVRRLPAGYKLDGALGDQSGCWLRRCWPRFRVRGRR